MRMKLALGIVGLCVLTQGCGLAVNAARNINNQFQQCLELQEERCRNSRLAAEAWASLCQGNPGNGYSADYGLGFRDGFTDYLEAGGSGEPPPLPPHHYWKARYQTPQGYKAIEDWFAGFRHGASAAQQSGYRQWVTVPVAVPPPPPGPVPPPLPGPAPPPVVNPPALPPALPEEVLPPPRSVPAKPGEPAGKAEPLQPPQTPNPAEDRHGRLTERGMWGEQTGWERPAALRPQEQADRAGAVSLGTPTGAEAPAVLDWIDDAGPPDVPVPTPPAPDAAQTQAALPTGQVSPGPSPAAAALVGAQPGEAGGAQEVEDLPPPALTPPVRPQTPEVSGGEESEAR